jgi:hypothetical protein
VLNDLEQSGFYIQNIMGTPSVSSGPDRDRLKETLEDLTAVRDRLQDVEAAIGELGEFDPRVNMRASIYGALELVELLRGAFEHRLRAP